MKAIKNIWVLALLFATAQVANAQTDETTTKRIVEAKNFIFKATTAMPMSNMDVTNVMSRMGGGGVVAGGNINLTGGYEVKIEKDSIEAYLPYFGRAFTPQMDPSESGIKFKTKDFNYKSTVRRKGGWLITIKPKDTRDRQDMTLTISENGYASLSVVHNNRQPISFSGYLAEIKEKKK